MNRLANATGRVYHLFDYFGHPQATEVIVTMASSVEVVKDTVKALNAAGRRAGVVAVRLFRPFSADALLRAIPDTVTRVAVLDRTKEPGSQGEPLFLDVATAMQQAGRSAIVIGGRYGLSSKEFSPAMAKAVFDNLVAPNPVRGFTVGIDDDVTHLSLPFDDSRFLPQPQQQTQCVFFGMGSDGTVGATRQAAHIITSVAGLYAQAYFSYSAKKSGAYTVSQLRFGPKPISSEYSIIKADYVACHKDTYVNSFPLLGNLKPGGIFVLNSPWTAEEMSHRLPASLRRDIARLKVRFYNIDAQAIAQSVGLGHRINTIMETVFLSLTTSILIDRALAELKQLITTIYMHEGGAVVSQNIAAVNSALDAVKAIDYPADWINAVDEPESDADLPEFIRYVARPCSQLRGNSIPVSRFNPSGTMPMGTTAYEKRTIAVNIPEWDSTKCVQCTECSLVCPHAAIRPVILSADEAASAPAQFISVPAHDAPQLRPYRFRIQVYPQDCVGCGSCSVICPGHALTMMPLQSQLALQKQMLEFAQHHVTPKTDLIPADTIPGTQLQVPLLQFSGACAGCGETPYVKLLTQLFGKHSLIANATGCSSIWGANFPSNAYCTAPDGRGPAWGNSLFEDNAEYGYGMASAVVQRRQALLDRARQLVADDSTSESLRSALSDWINAFSDPERSFSTGKALAAISPEFAASADMLGFKSVWAVGGDGWAYDIGFAGLDHVLAQNININLLVLDTECYSNTGGQTSKATPLGAVMKYAADGKRTYKKDLGRMMMTYGTVYVASVALGANYQQTILALREAEAYPGPSIVIAYCPCINHGIRSGMSHSIVEERLAVEAGYWPLYRYNPSAETPLTIDRPTPQPATLPSFLAGEDRYADLRMLSPAEADRLQDKLSARARHIYSIITANALNHDV